ncbi:MAG: hypothetical protein IID61_17900, partial [SAR324 cluster bacterium]|nr:hypothetical protein [SAR324 cluster bacterium]
MRSRGNAIVGLDIGTTKICALAADPLEGEPMKITGFGMAKSDGISKGVVVNIEKTVRSIQHAVRECELMSGTQIRSILAGIAGQHIMGRNSHGMVTVHNNRTVSEEDIHRVIEAAQAEGQVVLTFGGSAGRNFRPIANVFQEKFGVETVVATG